MTDINNDTYLEPEIQEFIDLMNKTDTRNSPFVKKSRIVSQLQQYGEAMNTLLVYPDIFCDLMVPKGSSFSLFFEQRMVLRAMQRYRQSYFTFTRSFSKSFLAFISRYQMCMFMPRYKAFVTAGTKTQAAQIAREKVIDDLWVKFPLLANEMRKFKRQGKSKDPFVDSGDSVAFWFPNGSIFDVIGGHMRGGRRHGGIFEEIIEQDSEYVNETIIPLLNTIRRRADGTVNPYEPQGQKIFVTTAGYMQSYAYDKLVETLCYSIIDPKHYIVMGGSYKIPIMHGLLSEQTMKEILSSPSFRADQVDREYRSIWSSAIDGAAFDINAISEMRKIKNAEYKPREDIDDNNFYAISADLAKDGGAATAVVVWRVSAQEFSFRYRVVNAFVIDANDYEVVGNVLKLTALNYKARLLVYDANGIGAALRDWINKDTVDSHGMPLQGLGIINPPSDAEDTLIKYRDKTRNICYEIKSGGQKASDIHRIFFSKMSSGSIRLLVKSAEALHRFEQVDRFAKASRQKKDEIMRPYLYTDRIEEELKNLDIKETNDTVNQYVKIVRRNAKIQKDFFSALEYGVYAILQYIEQPYYTEKRKKQKRKAIGFAHKTKGHRSTRR